MNSVLRAPPACLVLLLAALSPLVLGEPRTAALARNTLLLAGLTAATSVPLGALVAMLLVRTDLPCRKALALPLVGMLFVPLILQTGAWRAGFSDQGWYTLAVARPAWLAGLHGAVWIHALAALPWVVLFVAAGLWNVERELEELALLDGSPRQVFLHVTLRRALPAVGVAALWVAVVTAGEMTVTDFFQVRTFAEELYTQVAVEPEPGLLPLSALPGIAVTSWVVVAALLLVAALGPVAREPDATTPLVFRLRAARWPATLAMALAVGVVVGVPVGSLAWKAGVVVTQTTDERIRSWSPAKCASMVCGSLSWHAEELGWSLVIGASAATAALVVSAPVSWLARRGGGRALAGLALAAAALAVPGPVVGVVVGEIMNRPGPTWLNWLYDQSIAAVVVVQAWRALPLPLLVLWQGWRSLSSDVLDCAAVDGARPWALFWRIAVAQRRRALGVAWLLAFAAALAEVDATFIVRPPGVDTLATWIFEQLHNGPEDVVTSVSLAMYLGFQGLTWCTWRLALGARAGQLFAAG